MDEFKNEEINENIEQVDSAEEVDNLDQAEAVDSQDPNEFDDSEKSKRVAREIFSWVKIIVIALLVALIINNFIIINANVPSGSMENTIITGDRMIGLRTAYWFSAPKRGQVVIFKFPDNEDETFVKRVIGLPGETVHIKKGKIYINDSKKPLKEDYLKEPWYECNNYDEPFKVPKDSYFCLGDNRNVSNDARFWSKKYVKRNKILAKAEFVYWPWSNRKIIHTADY
ncbi:MAG: signal peptidase I [Eubacterium sp.]|nr:signal peptidase I [Eubacterium sp.]